MGFYFLLKNVFDSPQTAISFLSQINIPTAVSITSAPRGAEGPVGALQPVKSTTRLGF